MLFPCVLQENFYRLAFSHPAVEGVLMWQFLNNHEPASLVGDDMVLQWYLLTVSTAVLG